MSEDYLHKVHRHAEDALVQHGAVGRCERHNDVLLHNPDYEDSPVPEGLAINWLKQYENIVPMREDVRDAIQNILDGAVRDGCPICARQKDS